MIPGMDPRMMKQAMKRMGIKQEEIHALEVVIKTPDKEIVITNPSVQKIMMGDNDSFQISGEIEERAADSTPDINEEDVQTVMEQTKCSEDEAQEAILAHEGDLASAIMSLKEEQE